MSIIIKSDREIALIREAGKIAIDLFKVLKEHTLPGISTGELDRIAEKFIKSRGAIPSCKGYGGFPGNICISVNDTLVHGIPSNKIILKEGDIVTYDVLVTLNGYTADAARTFPVGKVSDEALKLIQVTEESFFKGVEEVKPGNHIGDIGAAISEYVRPFGYTLTEEFTGHGVGREVHEDPYVPNVGKRGVGPMLKKGMTIAIEPMVNLGSVELKILPDGWTTKTKDGKICSHYENTVVVTDLGYEILTLENKE
ncbi:MAG: type I methionyl aminopeptidase [Bacilli bacterium]|nr:type I methionyl aminopeptidase [Bacilli bacterium]